MGGVYDIPAVFMAVRGVLTNTLPIDAYRGAGKPEANYLIERLIDRAARRLALDPVTLRRRNLISHFPHRSGLGVTIDCGRFADNLGEMAQRLLADGFAARRQASAQRGRLGGLGIACFLETSRGTPGECAEIRFEADGRVALVLGTQSNGQGHETFPTDRRRSPGAANCRIPLCPGRHESSQKQQWAWRRPLDAYGRQCAVPGGADGAVQGPHACRPFATSRCGRGELQRRAASQLPVASAASICWRWRRPLATPPICPTE
jgi:hypothetical protein